MRIPNERQLVRVATGGGAEAEQAFRQLYEASYGSVRNWIKRMMQDRLDDVEDVVANTYMKAWRGLAQWRGESSFVTWLHRIAFNEVAQWCRPMSAQTWRTVSLELKSGSECQHDEQDTFTRDVVDGRDDYRAAEARMDLEKYLRGLSPYWRSIVEARMAGYSGDEIAEEAGASVRSIKSHLHRAMKEMRMAASAGRLLYRPRNRGGSSDHWDGFEMGDGALEELERIAEVEEEVLV